MNLYTLLDQLDIFAEQHPAALAGYTVGCLLIFFGLHWVICRITRKFDV